MTPWLLVASYACAPDPGWTRQAALEPTLHRMDADGDGVVGAAEYEAKAWAAPAFAQVDGDGSGQISWQELQSTVFAQDPLTFMGRETRGGPQPFMARTAWPRSWEQRTVSDLLGVLADDLTAVDSKALLGRRSELEKASEAAGRSRLPLSRALGLLREAYAERQLAFPEDLDDRLQAAGI